MAAGEGGSDGAESQQGGTNSSQQGGTIRTEGDVVGPSTSATESGISSHAVWANDGAVEGRHTGRMDRAKLFSLVDAVVPDGRGPDRVSASHLVCSYAWGFVLAGCMSCSIR